MNDKPLLKTPGEMINEAREAQGLTIAQLSERTKIPPPVLSALELDEYHKISGPLYIKSFLRTCATDLGLEPESVLGLYNKISGEQRGGSGGKDMIWEEEKVQVSRIGLPWIPIILIVGIVAILVGVGMFSLRGCGADEGDSLPHDEEAAITDDVSAATIAVPASVLVDTTSENASRRESLIPAEKEAELKELAAGDGESEASDDQPVPETRNIFADTLSLGWKLSPPEPVVEDEVQTEGQVAAGGTGGIQQAAESVPDDSPPVVQKPEEITEQISHDDPVDVAEDTPEEVPVTIARPEDSAVTVEIVAEDWIDSAWPLVLRVICDTPQRIQVKRDGDREFREVHWPAESETAPEVPAAGFEAGRAYRQGDRLVVFWGADDHFSLVLARLRGVEVAVNGRIRDISKLRAGQELILDSHSAGSSRGR